VFRWKTWNQNTSRDFVLPIRFSIIVSSLSYFPLGKYVNKNNTLSQKLSMSEKAPHFPHAKTYGAQTNMTDTSKAQKSTALSFSIGTSRCVELTINKNGKICVS
jgi:hypothetical protein